MQRKPVPPGEDSKTRDAAERHRAHPEPTVQGQIIGRQLFDTDGEGGVGGSTDGLYLEDQGTKGPSGNGPGSPRQNPTEVGTLDYDRAHAELGDGSADFTSERAEQALATLQGDPDITESLTSSGVMDENLDLGAEAEGRDAASAPRKPPDSAIQKP